MKSLIAGLALISIPSATAEAGPGLAELTFVNASRYTVKFYVDDDYIATLRPGTSRSFWMETGRRRLKAVTAEPVPVKTTIDLGDKGFEWTIKD
jgi:hypothetical protein